MMTRLLIAACFALLSTLTLAATPCLEVDGCVRVTGIGHGVVRTDDDLPHNVRQIMAIRAAKLDALRALAEQVHGMRLQSRSSASGAELALDRVVTQTDATLRGVRYVRVEPIQSGIYQAVAEMDLHQ